MKIHQTLYAVAVLLLLVCGGADAQEVVWMQRMSASLISFGNVATADHDGNFYVTGTFGGSMDFGGATLVGEGLGDAFITKYNSAGKLQWVKQGASSGWNGGRGIAIDGDGSVIWVGRIEGQTTFDGVQLPGIGQNDVYVVKYAPNGTIQWGASSGGAGMDWANAVAVDQNGNIYVTGYYNGNATFGTQSLSSKGQQDIFIASYNPTGTLRWVQSAGGAENDAGYGLAVGPNGDVYLTGIVGGAASFGTTNVPATDSTAFIARLGSADGSVKWVKAAKNGSTSESITINSAGEIFIAGSFTGNLDVGGQQLSSAGAEDIYLAKYNGSGELLGAWRYGSTGRDGVASFGQSVEIVAEQNSIYMTSSFEGTIALGSVSLESRGSSDIFVAKLSENGEAEWAISGGGGESDHFVSLGVDGTGNAYLLGNYFSPTFAMGGRTLPRFGSVDMVMVKIEPPGLAKISLTANSLDFEDIILGETTTADLWVSAGNSTPLQVSAVYFDDAQSESKGFKIIEPDPNTLPTMLSSTDRFKVTVEFTPQSEASVETVLVLETNAASGEKTEVAVTGNGLDGSLLPRAVISTSELNIGDVWVGSLKSGSFTISPGTSAGLVIQGLEFEDPRSIDKGFFLASPTQFPVNLQAGESVEVKVEFTPEDLGSATARISITTNDDANPFKNVDVRANATEAPVANISLSEVDFGEVEIGSPKQTSLKITAGSQGTLDVNDITLSQGSETTGVRLVSPAPGTTFPMQVRPGQELEVVLEFTPQDTMSVQTILTVETNDPAQSLVEIPVSGEGLAVASSVSESGMLGEALALKITPNPVSTEGTIKIETKATGQVRVELHDITGTDRIVVFDGWHGGGTKRISLDATGLQSGTYICMIEIAGKRYHRVVTVVQ